MLSIRKAELSDEKIGIALKLQDYINNISSELNLDWILYLWYPLINTNSNLIQLDAILIDKKLWVIIFTFLNWKLTNDKLDVELNKQKEIRRVIFNKLNSKTELSDYDEKEGIYKLKVKIHTITFAPDNIWNDLNFLMKKWLFQTKKEYAISRDQQELKKDILSLDKCNISDENYKTVISIIQDVINLKLPKKRFTINKNSKWEKLNIIEDTISNLDCRQEDAIINSIEWIQRIRWLAWSWKTVVLALKIALFHSLRPNDKIAVTFHSRSLKQQFKNLIERFCYSKWIEPNWNNINIIHAWGSSKEEWIYYNYCINNWLDYLTYWDAKIYNYNKWIESWEFEIICKKAVTESDKLEAVKKEYDAIFIDEAQDLSQYFLKICYNILNPNKDNIKRLVYAYDELQKLDKWESLPSPNIIFPWELINENHDYVLNICYRNSKENLTIAHALWFGIYNKKTWKPIQFFNTPSLWSDIWYLTNNKLEAWEKVSLYRDKNTSPWYFEEYFNSDEFFGYKKFNSPEEQADYIINEVEKNLNEDELLPNDILIIYPTEWQESKNDVALIRSKLLNIWINSYIAWWDSPDIFAKNNSVTITWIYRAKWNEAGMIYIINSDKCAVWKINQNLELQKLRNILFTSITRSKAWCRLYWVWNNMDDLIYEIEQVKNNNYKLNFLYPSDDEIEHMNKIYREESESNKRKIIKKNNILSELNLIVEDIKNGRDDIENYPNEIQDLIKQIIKIKDEK